MSRNLKRVAQFVADSGKAFSEPQIRWLIHKANENGLHDAGAIVRIGRCVYVDIDAFDAWITAQNARMVA